MDALVGPAQRGSAQVAWGERWVRFFAPSDAPSRWHVSPGIDLSAYAFSWVFMAVPMLWFVSRNDPNIVWLFMVSTLITDLHRHYTLPYVYLDGDVRRYYPVRFWFLPAVFFALWMQTPVLARSFAPLTAIEMGAIGAWFWFTVQLVRQDRGGRFTVRVALPCYLGPIAFASLFALAGTRLGFELAPFGNLAAGWSWLAAAVAGSATLHLLVRRDTPGDVWSGSRSPLIFPLGVASIALVSSWSALSSGASSAFSVRSIFNLVLITFLLWHFYHVLMQKYGIMRIYSAKSGQTEKVPGWVDRLVLVSVLPLLFVWVGGYELESLVSALSNESSGLGELTAPSLGFLRAHFASFVVVGVTLWVASIAIFVAYEWRVHRLQNAPRLCFAGATTLFYTTYFKLGLFCFYSTFSVAHGIEYIAFIWAFQRRKYLRTETSSNALRLLVSHPAVFYSAFSFVVLGAVAYARYQARIPFLAVGPRQIFGETAFEWIRWYTVYQGILHFYYDGFLWKMRRPSLRREM